MTIYQRICDANLDRELESILLKLLRYNSSDSVKDPMEKFLSDYKIISDDYWQQFQHCSEYDNALDVYYQYSKNKCLLIDTLLNDLHISLNFGHVQEDLVMMMREGFTF